MTVPWRCAQCRALVAPGAPRCPECPSTQFIKPEAEMSLKISRDGTVSDSAALPPVQVDASAAEAQLAEVQAQLDELAAMEPAGGVAADDEPEVTEAPEVAPESPEPVAEVPAEPQVPDAAPGPAPAPPRVPPRLTPPGAPVG